jgi:hypothetical protein
MVEFLEILVLVKFIQKERALNVAVTWAFLFFFFHFFHCLLFLEALREVLELFLIRSEFILELQRTGFRHYLLRWVEWLILFFFRTLPRSRFSFFFLVWGILKINSGHAWRGCHLKLLLVRISFGVILGNDLLLLLLSHLQLELVLLELIELILMDSGLLKRGESKFRWSNGRALIVMGLELWLVKGHIYWDTLIL